MKISIVIPAYNEKVTLAELVIKVTKVVWPQDWSVEIIVVNDGSKDNTLEIAQELASKYKNIKVLDNPQNMGKSQTVRNGVMASTGDVVVIQDADLEYDPQELREMIDLMLQESLDVVYGDRFGKKNTIVYWQNYIGNRFLSFVSNLFTYPRIRRWIPDMEVCYKMFRGQIARDIFAGLISTSLFGLEPEMTAKMAKYKVNGKRVKLGIVPISYFPRTIAAGKHMKAYRDGAKALIEILRFNLFS